MGMEDRVRRMERIWEEADEAEEVSRLDGSIKERLKAAWHAGKMNLGEYRFALLDLSDEEIVAILLASLEGQGRGEA